ncbi:MAG TPA: hypothetical protein VGN20_06535 [Mucilaginibacter sp.]|jgi:hypothetical protein
MRKLFYLIPAVVMVVSCSPNYNKIMGKAVKKAIGSDLSDYSIFSYPTDNFGLVTSYQGIVADTTFICDMWNCIGVNNPPSSIDDWLKMSDLAGVGTGGSIDLTERQQQQIAANVILPKIYDIVGVNGGFKSNKTTQITISIGKAYLRKLRKDAIIAKINSLDNSSALKKSYNTGSLVLIIADCVIDNMSVDVQVDSETAANIDAKIGATSGTAVASKIFSDASLSVQVDKTTSGKYSFKVTHPVVFARLAKHQPASGTLGATNDFEDWVTVKPQTYRTKSR